MGSKKNKSPEPSDLAASSQTPPDAQDKLQSQPAMTTETMDQSPEPMPSTPSASTQTSMSPSSSSQSKPPASTEPAIAPTVDEQAAQPSRQQPIPPASEPMQYRAIGLVRAKYIPSESQFTRGRLVTDDNCEFDAVLLGRVMSLVKKHLNPEQSHLWVVYPRTREKEEDLHVQIVGVWEPETLDSAVRPDDEAVSEDESVAEEPAIAIEDEPASEPTKSESESTPPLLTPPKPPKPPDTEPTPAVSAIEPEDGYFSIRGEIIHHLESNNQITVKIQQSPRRGEQEGRAFKLILFGELDGRLVGHFWDLGVQRQGNQLIVQHGERIGVVPPRRRAPGASRRPSGKPRFGNSRDRVSRPGSRPTPTGGGSSSSPPPPIRRNNAPSTEPASES